jgi:predicted amidohydrolase YtcJ
MLRLTAGALSLLLALVANVPAAAQIADAVFLNGKVVTLDPIIPKAEAIAVRDGRILAVGASAHIAAMAGPRTRTVDLAGRTVIPGLIDSHIHAIRAGLTYATEVHWIGARTLAEAMERLRVAAKSAPEGTWLVVAGGWTERQFAEGRRPTQDEVAAAAPGRKVYVQLFYSAVLLSPGGLDALGVAAQPELASRPTLEEGPDGKPTGWLSGDNRTISDLFDLLPRPTFEQQVAGTRAFFKRLNSLGITGVLDPGGYNMPLSAYRALFQVWRERRLTLRVAYNLCAPRRGRELADFQAMTAAMPPGFGDDWLRFNGIGENVTWGFYNNDAPDEAQRATMLEVLRWAAGQGLSATFHWHNDRSVHHLLDAVETVDRETPVAKLRWSVAHLNDASEASLRRIRALGMGWLVQNAMYFRGEAFLGQRGADALRLAPPIGTALWIGVPVGGGTDAHRVMSYNPFVSLQWMLDGKTVSGLPTRSAEEIPTREQALRLYTSGSAWFAHGESERGSLSPGKLADFAVLSADYFAVPVEAIGGLVSHLTVVGGRIVHASGPYDGLEPRAGR